MGNTEHWDTAYTNPPVLPVTPTASTSHADGPNALDVLRPDEQAELSRALRMQLAAHRTGRFVHGHLPSLCWIVGMALCLAAVAVLPVDLSVRLFIMAGVFLVNATVAAVYHFNHREWKNVGRR